MSNDRRCRGCVNLFVPSRPHHRLCWDCFWREPADSAPPQRRSTAEPLIDARTLRAAVALTHPDRHPPERAEQALLTTQALSVALTRIRELEAAR